MSSTIKGNILTPGGWIHGAIAFGERVDRIEGASLHPSNNSDDYILPGFIDLHVHGGAGKDIMEGGEAVYAIAAIHARHGTTSLLATTMTAPPEDIDMALTAIGIAANHRRPNTARVLGVHLEGPFLNLHRLGAQPPDVVQASLALVQRFHAIAPIKVLTMAPEIPGHLELIPQLAAMGIRVQIGHSAGTYDEGVAALKAGVSGFTHLYNGMTGMTHYDPGMVGAALAHAEYAEIIPDLQHVAKGALRAALRAIPRLYGVTDATSATGMPDGEYQLGSHTVTKCLGGVRLADGTLAGSTLTMDQALRNLVKIGLPISEASQRLSQFPADYLGLEERGRLQPGSFADCVRLDRSLTLTDVMVEGDTIDFKNA